MKTMPDLPNAEVLRKSLDAVDRGRVWMRVITIGLMLCALFFILAMTVLADSTRPRAIQLEVMSGSIGVILAVFSMGVAIIRTSNSNAARILKAMELLSEHEPKLTP